ncbi:hypothetical protein EJ06DRAFT_534851 [Trichodelitschia bisporula]|uniref:Uncharacterized protein n=1 Tax=Trichodelitschia bisporula TaxID=703511 RepID=A0A6G1HHP0_9PEZI|nr:hypothetical protein EJ06DRAFT_534851 [Trichodelitschia bisporula]
MCPLGPFLHPIRIIYITHTTPPCAGLFPPSAPSLSQASRILSPSPSHPHHPYPKPNPTESNHTLPSLHRRNPVNPTVPLDTSTFASKSILKPTAPAG